MVTYGRCLGLTILLYLSSARTIRSQVSVIAPIPPSVNSRIVPQGSAIAVLFKTPMSYIPQGQEANYPITGFLLEPLMGDGGNVLVPANTLVTLHLQPTERGALMSGNGIVVGGRLISIKTSSILLPAQSDISFFGAEFVPSPGVVNRVSTSFLEIVTDSDALKPELKLSLGIGLAIAAGLSTPKPKSPPAVVTIGENSVQVLTLSAPLTLPADLLPAPTPSPNALKSSMPN